jgi:hypothetical protein
MAGAALHITAAAARPATKPETRGKASLCFGWCCAAAGKEMAHQ